LFLCFFIVFQHKNVQALIRAGSSKSKSTSLIFRAGSSDSGRLLVKQALIKAASPDLGWFCCFDLELAALIRACFPDQGG
jgi:hypothetical protein